MSGTSGVTAFMERVRAGDVPGVVAMARADKTLVRATDPACFGATALNHAAAADDRTMADALLALGADVDQRSDWWAGSFGALDFAGDEMAEHLLRRGATLTPHGAARLGKIDELRAMLARDPGLVHARGGDGQTPLHFARTPAIADLLLGHGAKIDALDIDHASTPAQWLGELRPEVAAHLVSRGAAPDPFMAVRTADLTLLESLVHAEPAGVSVRVTRERFPAPAPAAGHIYIYTIGEGCGLVNAAVSADRPEVIRWLKAHGADVDARGGYDDGTPLHGAAWGDKVASIAALLDAGADINAKSGPTHRNEPIGWAIVSGAAGAVRAFLERGAKVRPEHVEDAKRGVEGAFRHFNRRRPLEAWREIARLLEPSGRAPTGPA
jgi:ankyrin repeat protein